MKKLITVLTLFVLTNSVKSQTVDNAVKQVMKPTVDSLKDAISKTQIPANVVWDEILIHPVTRSGNMDTLTVPGIYVLSVEGPSRAVRYIHFFNGQLDISNPMPWKGPGSWSVSVINGRVIVSTTATGITYKRRKL